MPVEVRARGVLGVALSLAGGADSKQRAGERDGETRGDDPGTALDVGFAAERHRHDAAEDDDPRERVAHGRQQPSAAARRGRLHRLGMGPGGTGSEVVRETLAVCRHRPIMLGAIALLRARARARRSCTVAVVTAGPTIDELTVADEPRSWEALGFTVDDGACAIGSVSLRLAGAGAGRGIVGWSLHGVDGGELDGLPTSASARERRTPAPMHPNGVVAIDHVVVMSPALMRSVEALERAGLELRRIRDEPTPAGAPRQAFFRLGAEILEVVQEPEDIVARAGGPGRPAHFWGLAMLVEDIDAAVAQMAPHTSEPRTAVQPGRRIATVRRSAGLAVPLALMSRDERGEEGR